MTKDQKPDPQNPDEAAMEEHVRRLMDIKAPDPPPPGSTSAAIPIKNITISDSDTEATPAKSVASPPKSISISQSDDDVPVLVSSAPTLPTKQPAETELAPPKPVIKKSIAITHLYADSTGKIDDSTTKPTQKIHISHHEFDEPLPPADPLIPTDKLAETIEPTAKKGSKKSTPQGHNKTTSKKPVKDKHSTTNKRKINITEEADTRPLPLEPDTSVEIDSARQPVSIQVSGPADVIPEKVGAPEETIRNPDQDEAAETDSTDTDSDTTEQSDQTPSDLDTEIARAFVPAQDELDELATESTLSPEVTESEPSTAPEVPSATETESAPKPKFDKFKPLTNIRPQLPPGDKKHLPLKLDDDGFSQAVEDITITEADSLLTLAGTLPIREAAKPQPHAKATLRKSPNFWRSKTFRKVAIVLVIVGLVAIVSVPVSQAAALNMLGIRTRASVDVLDQSTGQPLKSVNVTVGGQSAETDASGQVTFNAIKLGVTSITAQRRAFATTTSKVRLGLGTNKLSTLSLIPTGSQHSLAVVDYLTGKSVKALVDSQFGSAETDNNGMAKLTIERSLTKPFTATVSAPGYRSEQLTIDPAKANTGSVSLVLASKYVYLNKQDGTLNVYRSDFDGQNQQLILKGSGNEQTKNTILVANPTDDEAALVSTRSSTVASDGSPLRTLTILHLHDGTSTSVVQAAQIQIINWVGRRLVYTVIPTDSMSTSPTRQQLISYDYKTKQSKQLAAANYFNDVLSAGGRIFYAPSSAYQPLGSIGFYGIDADGSAKSAILPLETWNVYRTSFSHLSLSVQQDWYDFKLGNQLASKQSNAPASLDNFLYVESPDGQHGLRVEGSGGQANLLVYDKNTGKENKLISEDGLSYPVRWLNNTTLVYRINNSIETADYAYSLEGTGTPKKIYNVIDVAGLTPWQVH